MDGLPKCMTMLDDQHFLNTASYQGVSMSLIAIRCDDGPMAHTDNLTPNTTPPQVLCFNHCTLQLYVQLHYGALLYSNKWIERRRTANSAISVTYVIVLTSDGLTECINSHPFGGSNTSLREQQSQRLQCIGNEVRNDQWVHYSMRKQVCHEAVRRPFSAVSVGQGPPYNANATAVLTCNFCLWLV